MKLLIDANLSPHVAAELVLANLPTIVEYIEPGCVVSISTKHLRMRPLPMR
ncbi:MAG TPA: hypothetical protein VFA45_15000 [Actinomycetes bacterium]|jgi:hypothetical protein|nr:hypothetical protein [Actinomycetes bacterium]